MRYNDVSAFFLFLIHNNKYTRKEIGFLRPFVNKITRIYEEEFRK